MRVIDKKRLLEISFVLLLFLILFYVRIYSSEKKEELHTDEIYSVMLANNIKYYWSNFEDGEYSGEDLKHSILNNCVEEQSSLSGNFVNKDLQDDLAHLWKNNGDTPHASLYYMFLRISFYFNNNLFTSSPKDVDIGNIIETGVGLNLLFFSISFLLFWALLRNIAKRNILIILVGLAVAFGNKMSIENTLLIREYQLAEVFIIALTLLSVNYVYAISNAKKISIAGYFFKFGLIVSGALSTGYLNAIYVLLIGCVIIVYACRYGRAKDVIFIVGSAILGLIMSWVIYNGFFNFLLYKTVHTSRAFESPIKVFDYVFDRDLLKGCFTIYGLKVVILMLLIILFSSKRKALLKLDSYLWLPLIAVVSMYLIQYTAVLKMSRYSYPLVSITTLILPLLMNLLPKISSYIFGVVMTLFYILIGFVSPVVKTYGWNHIKKEMSQPAMIYRLNSTEIVQLIPCLSDTVSYEVCNTQFNVSESTNKDEKQSDEEVSQLPNRIVMKSNCKDFPHEVINDRRRLVGKSISIIVTKSVKEGN